jgi:thioredoxin 1
VSQESEYGFLTGSAFAKDILNCSKLVIVEFGAEWCGSCRVMTSIINDISAAYREQIRVIKLDIERNRHLVEKYSIRAKPTFLFIKNGEVVDHIIGSAPRKDFENKLISLLSKEKQNETHF